MFLDALKISNEIEEGFLVCTICATKFPVIQKIPIIMENFVTYIENRPSLGGMLYELSTNTKMKEFIKKSLSNIKKTHDDYSIVEKQWAEIYKSSRNSSFYSVIKNTLSDFPSYDNVLEFGSSIGIISNFLRKKHKNIFSIDQSFFATLHAKKKSFENSDFFVADVLNHPFQKKKFDLVLALNMLDLVEPLKMLENISRLISHGHIILTDPYDYVRGKKSIKSPLYEKDVRKKLQKLGFVLTKNTSRPRSINWTLKINPRTKLIYSTDLIIGKK